MKPLKGIHHVTAITSSAERIYTFFTYTLGMRLVKKTINQDDIHTYHLFFADNDGSAGTDITFFDFPNMTKAIKGTNSISRTSFRVPSDAALSYWITRFTHYHVRFEPITTLFGKQMVFFYDFDDQEYALISDEHNQGIESGTPWLLGPVPNEYGITGLGPVFISVAQPKRLTHILEEVLMMRYVSSEGPYTLMEMGTGGNGASLIIENQAQSHPAIQGYGAVHHVAFRLDDRDHLEAWIARLNQFQAGHSGLVDRFYFKSLYTRLYPPILFEFATDGPGFIDDEEDLLHLGETLALPPRFRKKRELIESQVRHFDTVRSTKTFKKETFE